LLANDGHQALDAYREHHATIVCVLLDLTMPNMDGEETYRELRLVEPNIQVVMASGYNLQELTERFIGRGLAGFIQKPFKYEELRAKLREVLGCGSQYHRSAMDGGAGAP
jgi:CheY-like chemotaxis protein